MLDLKKGTIADTEAVFKSAANETVVMRYHIFHVTDVYHIGPVAVDAVNTITHFETMYEDLSITPSNDEEATVDRIHCGCWVIAAYAVVEAMRLADDTSHTIQTINTDEFDPGVTAAIQLALEAIRAARRMTDYVGEYGNEVIPFEAVPIAAIHVIQAADATHATIARQRAFVLR